ncbi:HAD superfamily hydrolase [Spiroplasma helicoides]|uniref:HAD superfamily hydrolase n=1 Tax=Spiroplasma helicoides TaxID=216938 RepID=A0A1B3SKN2_9MOLU|nr:HAD family hydrolase [Spiroplasma helicoides]AOG60483.1 HAD superfamily hydrolase [Spiroplasma helicoides]
MNKYKKVVASDLDGTIVKKGNIISESCKEMIKDFMKKTNNSFTIVTGRNYFSAVQHIVDLGITLPVIATNGTSVINPVTNEYVAQLHFSNEEGNKILDVIYETNLEFYLLNDFKIYTLRNNRFADEDKNKEHGFRILLEDCMNFYDSREKLYHAIKTEVKGTFCSLNITCYDNKEKEYALNLLKQFDVEILEFFWDNHWTLEIYKKGAGKDWGLRALAKYLNISEDDLYVFGDEFNDYPMFKNFKNTYAMGNAIEGIKKLAKEVILPIDEDGVGVKIHQLLKEF